MMKKNKYQFNFLTFVGGILLVIILFVFGYGIYLYQTIDNHKTDGFSETEKFVFNKTEITRIDDIRAFQDEALFHIVVGNNAVDEKYILFVPVADKTKFEIIPFTEAIAEAEMIKQWQSICQECSSVKTNYAFIDGMPLWELTYIDQSNRYVFDYYSLDEGIPFEQFKLSRKFK